MKINLILLAAGNSKRFLENKLLYKINGKDMYMYILDTIKNIFEEYNSFQFEKKNVMLEILANVQIQKLKSS